MTVPRYNLLPLNRAAKEALLKLDRQPDPSNLYVLQLLDWGLSSLEFEGPLAKVQNDLLEQVRVMYGWKPKLALSLFEAEPPDQSEDPEFLVLNLAENLLQSLSEFRPELRLL